MGKCIECGHEAGLWSTLCKNCTTVVERARERATCPQCSAKSDGALCKKCSEALAIDITAQSKALEQKEKELEERLRRQEEENRNNEEKSKKRKRGR